MHAKSSGKAENSALRKRFLGAAASGKWPGVQHAAAIQELRKLIPRCLLPDQIRLGHALLRTRAHPAAASHGPPPPLARWIAEARESIDIRQRRQLILPGIGYPPDLPISARKNDILQAIRTHPVVVVAGETGSGKTTQLPKMLLEAGLGFRARIGCTQPRRVAALSISRRLAEELGVAWGHEVGCKIRFADDTRPESSLKVMTDGILLAELQGDPLLAEYEAIIIDEAHERSLNIDFLLGYLKQLLAQRDDLKLVITSATIDTDLFARAFGGAPVIEVSGRLYPVEVRHAPLDEHAEDEGELTYIDAAAAMVGRLLEESADGDILVFMPGERDIRETCDLLEARHRDRLDVVPLFGRLTAGDQQRVFTPGPARRVVVATNIAETSLTVPRIRYVVDTGLARLSRYSPGTRTHRLPIEPISQSSANQRQGRCGRVRDGVCVRLFSEEDFQARRPFTEPEIQRCDLAEVILRMKAWQLGEIETFPFLEPPTPAAINAAYQLLQEIGALDAQRALTSLGRDLSRLPVDPAIGRMLLQALDENAVPEVLIIAAGLSIQDPRERPLEQRDAAEAAHRRFQHPESDFLTLLNIWNVYHDEWEALKTQNQVRKFCKNHFLSFVRMREWRDVHAELEEAIAQIEFGNGPRPERGNNLSQPRHEARTSRPERDPRYAAVHRSILTGLWGHIMRCEDRNLYRVAGGRQAMVFPGSGLFLKSSGPVPRREGPSKPPPAPPSARQPEWLVAGEIVETTRCFARTVAAIDPEWVIELAPHLVRTTHDQTRWDPEAGRVLARERVLLRGLVLRERTIGYGRVQPAEATGIFIRAALVGEQLEPPPEESATAEAEVRGQSSSPPGRTAARSSTGIPAKAHARDASRHRQQPRPPVTSSGPRVPRAARTFLEHNRHLREKIELWQTRLSHRVIPDLDEALYQFYAARLQDVSSLPDLDRVLKTPGGPASLCANERDLLGEHAAAFDRAAFPDEVTIDGQTVPVRYAYAPGKEHDGVTLQLSVPLAERVDTSLLDWAVPSLREERIAHLLRGLPKAQRRSLMPLNETAREIATHVQPACRNFLEALSAFVLKRFGVEVRPDAWPMAALPEHLRPRLEVVARDGDVLVSGRDLPVIRRQASEHPSATGTDHWQRAAQQWERYAIRDWDFGELPEAIVVADLGGFPLRGHPALQAEGGEIHLRLLRRPEEADGALRAAVPRLAEGVLQREIAALQKDLRNLQAHGVLYASMGTGDELLETAWQNLRRHLFPEPVPPPRTREAFLGYVAQVRSKLPGLGARLADLVGNVLQKRQEVLLAKAALPVMQAELAMLVPARFLAVTPFESLAHLPRYLRGLLIRAERAALNRFKDGEKAQRVEPYAALLRQTAVRAGSSPEGRAAWHRLRWLVEELKIAVFAPELGTAEKVSPKRLEATAAELRQALG